MPAFDRVYRAIADRMPETNEYLVRGHMERDLASMPDFVEDAFSSAIANIPNLKLKGWAYASAEEHVSFELKRPSVLQNTTVLVNFFLTYKGPDVDQFGNETYVEEDIKVPMFFLYSVDGLVINNGTRYAIKKTIVDDIFNPTSKGGTVTVIRSPIHFERKADCHKAYSAIDGYAYDDYIIRTRIHLAEALPSRPKYYATVLHYLLSHYGLEETCRRFNYPPIYAVAQLGDDHEDGVDYIPLVTESGSEMYLRVSRSLATKDSQYHKLVTNIHYVLNGFGGRCIIPNFTINDVNKGTPLYVGILACTTKYGLSLQRAVAHCNHHLDSFSLYLDKYKKAAFARRGIHINDAFDLIQYIYSNIEELLLNRRQNNLYGATIETVRPMVVQCIVSGIMKRFYLLDDDSAPSLKRIKKALNSIQPNAILRAFGGRNGAAAIQRTIALSTGDGSIISALLEKMLTLGTVGSNAQARAPELAIDPSQLTVESMAVNTGKRPGATGWLNPFGEIDEDGMIVCPKSWGETATEELAQLLNVTVTMR